MYFQKLFVETTEFFWYNYIDNVNHFPIWFTKNILCAKTIKIHQKGGNIAYFFIFQNINPIFTLRSICYSLSRYRDPFVSYYIATDKWDRAISPLFSYARAFTHELCYDIDRRFRHWIHRENKKIMPAEAGIIFYYLFFWISV